MFLFVKIGKIGCFVGKHNIIIIIKSLYICYIFVLSVLHKVVRKHQAFVDWCQLRVVIKIEEIVLINRVFLLILLWLYVKIILWILLLFLEIIVCWNLNTIDKQLVYIIKILSLWIHTWLRLNFILEHWVIVPQIMHEWPVLNSRVNIIVVEVYLVWLCWATILTNLLFWQVLFAIIHILYKVSRLVLIFSFSFIERFVGKLIFLGHRRFLFHFWNFSFGVFERRKLRVDDWLRVQVFLFFRNFRLLCCQGGILSGFESSLAAKMCLFDINIRNRVLIEEVVVVVVKVLVVLIVF